MEPIRRQVSRRLQDKGRRAVEKLSQRLTTLEVVYLPIDAIRPNGYNPNRQSQREFELLMMSMQEDGFTQPIIVQQDTHEIVDGEHRWRAAHELGYEEVPVILVNMTAEQMRISTLRHNRARGSEDAQAVAAVLRDLEQLGSLDKAGKGLGLSQKELDGLLRTQTAAEALADEEYSQAWEPSADYRLGLAVQGGGAKLGDMSDKAASQHVEVEKQLASEPVPSVRADIMSRDRFFGIGVIVPSDIGPRLVAFLGDNPCAKILWIVEQELAGG